MKNKGVTLTELLIVIVVMGIIAAFSIVKVSDIVTKARVDVDSYNLATLNEVSEDYYLNYGQSNGDIFYGIDTDEERMQELVTKGLLTSLVRIQQKDASFEWDVDEQVWILVGGEQNDYYNGTDIDYSFDSDLLTGLTDNGTVSIDMSDWSTDNGYLENTTGESRLFIPINSTTYTISVNAALGTGNTGGYGIFFDTTLKDDNASKDYGYVFQFDRGYGSGAMIVRPRSNGSEGGSVWTVRDYHTTIFPSKYTDPTWWTSTHTVKIVVTNESSTIRNAEFFIDGQSIGDYSYSNAIDGEKIYTGFRGWGSSTTQFYSISAN